MEISICVTTIDRATVLDDCLQAIWTSQINPHQVIVSDDSRDPAVQQQNRTITEHYPKTVYLIGPGLGVCANRNNAVNAVTEAELVAFVDDDVCIEPDFLRLARKRYTQMSLEARQTTIITGITRTQYGDEATSVKLSWRGYFCYADVPQAVNIHATVFPRAFFQQEQWDENIFFGYEDAELCLRALRRGYHILYCPELKALHTQFGMGTLRNKETFKLTDYDINVEAARLYVGIKRYKDIFPNPVMLMIFLSFYVIHMTLYLLKHRSLGVWPRIFYRSNIKQLWGPKPTEGP